VPEPIGRVASLLALGFRYVPRSTTVRVSAGAAAFSFRLVRFGAFAMTMLGLSVSMNGEMVGAGPEWKGR